MSHKMKETKLTLEMSMMDIIMAISEGNPGAATVCVRILKETPTIDPQDAFGGIGVLMSLDTHNIYGSRVWKLYKDVCHMDLMWMIALLRAYQLGQLAGVTEEALDHAIDNMGEGVDVQAAVKAVMEELKHFNRPPVTPPTEEEEQEAQGLPLPS